jgi:hypothetical protein
MKNQNHLFEDFLELSVILTGFKKFRLFGTGQAVVYYDKIQEIIGEETVKELLSTFKDIFESVSRQETEELHDLLRAKILSDAKLGPVARNIILLWYVGSWYQLPADWRTSYGQNPSDVTFVLSPNSYTEGLLWPAIGAHPAGAKAQGFGSWASEPIFE